MGEEGSGVSPRPIAVTSNGQVQSRGNCSSVTAKTHGKSRGRNMKGCEVDRHKSFPFSTLVPKNRLVFAFTFSFP